MATYSIDVSHSEIGFAVRHMMFAKVRGHFKSWTANLQYDAAAPEKSNIQVDIDVASIDTREEKRDGHLRSADFFDVEKFPKMTFQSKRIESNGKGRYTLTGDLSIHGVTRELAVDVEETGRGKDPWGNDRLGFSARATISRSDWGLTWNQALEAGGVLVSDKVEIEAEVQVIQGK
jgi:polyisoprenoid-binding protein YceI